MKYLTKSCYRNQPYIAYLGLYLDILSHLTDRSFFLVIYGCHSSVQSVTFGVPQGSKLRPLLFNDISQCLTVSTPFTFADDLTYTIGTSLSRYQTTAQGSYDETKTRFQIARVITIILCICYNNKICLFCDVLSGYKCNIINTRICYLRYLN